MFCLYLKISYLVLDCEAICQLADEETPTSTSDNLGTTKNNAQADESENYNDISSK